MIQRLETEPSLRDLARKPFWAFPGWSLMGYFVVLAAIQSCWFGLIYVGCDRFTAIRELRIRLYFDFELMLPFVPSAVWVYSSVSLLFYSAPFILRSKPELRRLAYRMAVVTLIGGFGFLLLPAEVDFPYPTDFGASDAMFRFADQMNLDHNQLPSLHVALSAVCVSCYSVRASRIGKVLLWGWVVAIAVAAVLTYQHHLMDVCTGLLVGIVVDRWGGRKTDEQLTPANE